MENNKLKGPIFCGKDGKWKREFERRLNTYSQITLTALGKVRYDVLDYLRHREDIKIVRVETRYMKRREKGLGLKVTVRSYMPTLLRALAAGNQPKQELENLPLKSSPNFQRKVGSPNSRNKNVRKGKIL